MDILFIQTGGTIDKDYPKTNLGYAFEITSPAVIRILEKINLNLNFRIIPLLQKDSTELNENDRNKILNTCKNAAETMIIITHGTDTMIETAQFLSEIKDKLIIITGSMRPQRFTNTDADFNIGVTIGALSALNNGVYVAMNGRVFKHDNVKRNFNNGLFESIDLS